MTEQGDLALEALLEARAEFAPELDERLLRSCYAIQQKGQFGHAPAASLQAMERLVDEYVQSCAERSDKDGDR